MIFLIKTLLDLYRRLFKFLLFVMIGVFVVRIVAVFYMQSEFINIGMMMVMGYSGLAGFVYSFVVNKNENIIKLFVLFPLRSKQIWIAETVLILLIWIVITLFFIFIVIFLPKETAQNELEIISWLSLVMLSIIILVTTYRDNMQAAIVKSGKLKEKILFVILVGLYPLIMAVLPLWLFKIDLLRGQLMLSLIILPCVIMLFIIDFIAFKRRSHYL